MTPENNVELVYYPLFGSIPFLRKQGIFTHQSLLSQLHNLLSSLFLLCMFLLFYFFFYVFIFPPLFLPLSAASLCGSWSFTLCTSICFLLPFSVLSFFPYIFFLQSSITLITTSPSVACVDNRNNHLSNWLRERNKLGSQTNKIFDT